MSSSLRVLLWCAALTGGWFLIAVAARAQTAPDSIAVLTEDWNAYQNAQKHVLSSLNVLATELLKARTDLAAATKERDDLKAELDKLKAGDQKKAEPQK